MLERPPEKPDVIRLPRTFNMRYLLTVALLLVVAVAYATAEPEAEADPHYRRPYHSGYGRPYGYGGYHQYRYRGGRYGRSADPEPEDEASDHSVSRRSADPEPEPEAEPWGGYGYHGRNPSYGYRQYGYGYHRRYHCLNDLARYSSDAPSAHLIAAREDAVHRKGMGKKIMVQPSMVFLAMDCLGILLMTVALLLVVAVAYATAEAEAEADPHYRRPYYGGYGRPYGYGGYHQYRYRGGRYGRSADPEPEDEASDHSVSRRSAEPELEPEAEPWHYG
ncbi:uncharacterized protein LOC143036695 [Oratosquilla oratoria]|uniref:uncharacterized protein LOC143036695 n=1 Tax=Oratosquilla oratoria TaxID=337810 RepID=UPI003F76C4A8